VLQTYEQHSRRKLVVTLLSILVIAGTIVVFDHFKAGPSTVAASSLARGNSTTSNQAITTTPVATTTTSTTATTSSSASYHDGTYSGSSSYYVPHSNEAIQVSLTLKDGVITGVSVQNSEGDQESAYYQESFSASYKSYVVGKKISGLQIGVIAGASDTSQGFQDALNQISSKAQA